MSSSTRKVDSCSSGSTIGSVFEAMNKDLHMVMWLTEAILYMYGVVYLIWEKPPCAFSDVTGAVYRRVLEEHLVPHGRTWYHYNWLLADDNARPHRAWVVDAYLHEQDIIRIDWAPYRPDMNSIEHIWDEIGRGLEGLDPQSVNVRQLGVVVQNLWQQIPLKESRPWLTSSWPQGELHTILICRYIGTRVAKKSWFFFK